MIKVRKPTHSDNEEYFQAGPPATHQEDINNIRNLQKEFLDDFKPQSVDNTIDVDKMTMTELKNVIKEAAMEEVELDKSEKLVTPPEASTVSPIIETAINKVGETKL